MFKPNYYRLRYCKGTMLAKINIKITGTYVRNNIIIYDYYLV